MKACHYIDALSATFKVGQARPENLERALDSLGLVYLFNGAYVLLEFILRVHFNRVSET